MPSSLLDGLKNTLGLSGRKKYETVQKDKPFSGLSLKEKLERIAFDIRERDRDRRARRCTNDYVMMLYYQGYQNIEYSAAGQSLTVYEQDDYFIENQFRKHVDTVVQMLNRNEGDVLVRPASDKPNDIATARVADPILESSRTIIGYERVRDLKNLYKCLCGNAFVFTDYIEDPKYGSIVTPKYSYEEREDDMGETMLSKVVSGYDSKPKGRELSAVCSTLEINAPVAVKEFTSIPYLQWISEQDIETLEYLYRGLNVDSGTNEDDRGLTYIRTLSGLGGGTLDGGKAMTFNDQPKAELVRTWAQPCTFRGDKDLLKEFPDGVHITTVGGKIVDWYPENLVDRWTHEVLIPSPHSLLGDGLYDAILMNDQLNEMDSLLLKHVRYSTVGHKVYDSTMIDPKDVVNDPENGWIPARSTIDKNIGQSVKELPPSQLGQDVVGMRGAILAGMQDMTSAYDPTTGKGMGANTPYSQSVFLSERAQSRWQGSMNYNRPELTRFFMQLLKIAQKHPSDARSSAMKDNSGQWSFQQFAEADLQGEVSIIITNTDFKPRSRAEQIQGLQMLATLQPIIASMAPRQKLRIEEMLGLPPEANPMSNQIARAFRQIDRIKRGETVSPAPLLDDAAQQLPVFRDFLINEEGEALAESQPEVWANVHTYMVTLLQMSMMQQASPAGQMSMQMMGGGGGMPMMEGKGAAPPPSGEAKPPGGQMGQMGGGPQNGAQPNAQSPMQPAPPIQPPAAGVQGN